MKTRFDYTGIWIDGTGKALPMSSMETQHLLNTARMLIQKPNRVLSILIDDIEHETFDGREWKFRDTDDRRRSLKNVTSLSETELAEYVKSTPLFNSLIWELQERGVNTENLLNFYACSEAFR